ncbi:MAG: hypothetical protein LBH32_12370 [Dysgonamonadaceae bacterium]|jgi:hypothetical protein|nr:hypothetical protein [Dysgonamonadaceae bacterium]
MKLKILFTIFIALTVASCSPRIGKVITKTYSALENNEPIEVFMDAQTAPSNSESLGVASVTDDAGFSINCDSLTVINLLKEEARKVGGNAVLITEHVRPSFWGSSCHQMTATILKVFDYDSQNVQENPDSSKLTVIKVIKPERKLPVMNLSVNFGRGWRLAKINPDLTIEEKDYYKDLMSGWIYDASFNYYFNDFYGVGFHYSLFTSSQHAYGTATFDGYSETGYRNTNQYIQFIGPVFSARTSSKDLQWLFDYSIGIGYLGYSSKDTFTSHIYKGDGSTVGFYMGLGVEHKLNKNWGVGVRCSTISGVVTKMNNDRDGIKETITVDDVNKGEGLGQIQLLAGIRYYFGK